MENTNNNEIIEQISEAEQERIRREKLESLQSAGSDPFAVTTFDKTHKSNDVIENFEKMEGQTVSVAGRIVARRVMGKAAFAHILDEHGRVQVYISINDVGEEAFGEFTKTDLGDIIGVAGTVFKTKVGEVSVKGSSYVLLSKALRPLPDKHSGLKDPEARYRERHLDLIANPEVRDIFKTRSNVISAVRAYLDNLDFMEVETPILQNIPGGAEARPFITHHNTMNMKMYMRIAPELYLKRLIVGGFERVYEIGRVFRNEGISYKHNPEFTMMELYQAYTDWSGMADLTENIVKFVFEKCKKPKQFEYDGMQIDVGKPWERISMIGAVKRATGLDFSKLNETQAISEMTKLQLEIPKNKTWGELLYAAFEQRVEETLVNPTFIIDYPIEISPLAKKLPNDPRLTGRFELFIAGREMANAYSELNDPIDQRSRFDAQMAEREKGNDEAHQTDEDFLQAMASGMPPTGGLGIGIDRLVMLVSGTHSIRETLLFPTMRAR